LIKESNFDKEKQSWTDILFNEDKDMSFVMNIIHETLRIDPPVNVSFYYKFSETATVSGISFPKDTPFMINMHYLMNNPS